MTSLKHLPIVALIFTALGFSVEASAACLFGDHLVTLARLPDLRVGRELTITSDHSVKPSLKRQIIEASQTATIKEAFEWAGGNKILVREIFDSVHRTSYRMVFLTISDTYVGKIFIGETADAVAEISDGYIENCTASYQKFAVLPWFYVN